MAVKDILPSTNLTWDDIKDTLNANGGRVSNDVSTAFKEAAKINKWAKYKPVRLNQNFPDYDRYWQANDYYCGLDPQSARYSNEFEIGNIFPTWNYLPPRGGADEPFRLGDFRGYHPNANVQYVPIYPANVRQGGYAIISFPEQNYHPNTLKFTDILKGIAEDVWICVKVFHNPNIPGAYKISASKTPLSAGGNMIVSYRAERQGTQKAYPFLATKCEGGFITPQSEFYAFPDGAGINREGIFTVQKPDSGVLDIYEITSWDRIETNYRYIKYECTVKRKDGIAADLRPRDFLISYRIETEYGELWIRSQEKPNTSELPEVTLQSDNTVAKVKGTVYFDNTIMQAWTGDLILNYEIYDAGVKKYDALGGVHLEYK